jgi:hypothetical protein
LADRICSPCRFTKSLSSWAGWPIFTPSALASAERAIAQPSLFDSTMTGTPTRLASKARSQLT